MARKVVGTPRKRAVVALLLAGAVIGALFVGNAGAHFTQNTKHLGKHAWAQFIKQKADKRYLRSKVVVADGTSVVGSGSRGFVNVPCPSGYAVIGGGVRFSILDDDHRIVYNGPAFAGDNLTLVGNGVRPTAWQGSGVNGAAGDDTLHVWAICSKTDAPAVAAPSLPSTERGTSSTGDPTAPEFGG